MGTIKKQQIYDILIYEIIMRFAKEEKNIPICILI
jgi:hypothetical protein